MFFSFGGFWGLRYKTTTQNHSVGGACLAETILTPPPRRSTSLATGILAFCLLKRSCLCWGRVGSGITLAPPESVTTQEALRPHNTKAPGAQALRSPAPSAPTAQLPCCLPFRCLVTRSPNYSTKRSKKYQQPIA